MLRIDFIFLAAVRATARAAAKYSLLIKYLVGRGAFA